jgi:glycosyltransferase involved in cell wall biosynthesis
MTFSIITPSYGQLEWLRLCVASVADQNQPLKQGISKLEDGSLGADGPVAPAAQGVHDGTQSPISNLQSPARSPLAIEHIIQDAGTPGIEEFAKGMGEELMSRYGGELVADLQTFELLHLRTAFGYTLRIFKESDAGMYDAINKGIARSSGEICAWLNCDEQYLQGSLQRVRKMFGKKKSIDVLLGDAALLDEKSKIVSYRRIMKPSLWHTRLVHLHSLSCAMFFRRSAMPSQPLDPRWKIISDAVLMDYFLKSGKKIKACHVLLSVYCFTGENLSARPSGELQRWWSETKWPPRLFKMPVVMIHRIRRLRHGAYNSRVLQLSIYRSDQNTRSITSGNVSGLWPKPKISKTIYHGFSGAAKQLSFLSDEWFSRVQYLYKFKQLPNFKNPRTLNEKLQWLKIFYRDPLITVCANKSSARGFVRNQWGNDILIPLISELTRGTEFRLSELPEKFVLKAAHASGWNYICKDKHEADEASIRGLIDTWVASDFSIIGREAMYRGSKRVVVCEEFIDGGEGEVPRDYKFFCFHGEPQFVQVDYDRFSGHTRTLYDMEWKKLPCEYEYPYGPDETGHPPELFIQMIEIARSLSTPFPFVRVDLYESEGRVWFGEMTFCPEKACGRFNPPKYDLEFGKYLDVFQLIKR